MERFLLVRPRGGLNDTLVQLERTRRHAALYGRTLVVDLSQCGVRLPFDQVFAALKNFGCPVETFDENWAERLVDAITSAGSRRVTFDLRRDHHAGVLVHQSAGGGIASIGLLRRVALAPDLANAVVSRLAMLPGDHDAIHVRHTDIRTDAERLFANCGPMLESRDVLVCTDNADVQRNAAAHLPRAARVMHLSPVPDRAGAPLHEGLIDNPSEQAVSLFSDLIAMARARALIFAPLNKPGFRAQFSGFSILAEMLRIEPQVTNTLLSLADPSLLAQLPRSNRAPLSVRRRIAEADRWRWQFAARWQTLRLNLLQRYPGLAP